MIVTAVVGYMVTAYLGGYVETINGAFPEFNYFFPAVRLGEFAVGILVGHLFITREGSPPKLGTWAEVAALVALLFQVLWVSTPNGLSQLSLYVVMPAFIWVFAHEQGAISRFLAHSTVLRFLGEASFSLYMWHHMIMTLYARNAKGSVSGEVHIAAGILLTIIVSAVSYKLLELPARRLVIAVDRLCRQHSASSTR